MLLFGKIMKMIRIIILLFFVFLAEINSQSQIIPLWENDIPNKNSLEIDEIIDTTDIIKIRHVNNPSIEIFYPSIKNKNDIAILVIPGGGYSILAYDWEGTDIAKMLNSYGITACVLKYRLPSSKDNIDGKLSPFIDAQRAMRLIRNHSSKLGISSNKIGVIGFSAGGHLAVTLGTHYEEQIFVSDNIDSISAKPDFMVLMYPVVTFVESYRHNGSVQKLLGSSNSSELLEYYSGELNLDENTPPCFLVHSNDDPAVNVKNSLTFFSELSKYQKKSELHIYNSGGHGFGLALNNQRLNVWKDLAISWIKSLFEEKY